ncbi:LCP family protein [Candidatus Woesebacteria bacterium]|nr:LCP family protein [Candidatus Woesebacteria bacterium]
MKKTLKKLKQFFKKNYLSVILFTSLFIISFSATFIYFYRQRDFVKNEEGPITEETASITLPEDDPTTNVILLGMGGPGHEGATLTDTNILVRINTQDKKAAIITIPRDLWVPIPSGNERTTFNKLNKAYALGGGELSKDVISAVTGLRVDKFIAVDFVGFQRIFGLLGGIKVNVPKDYDDYFYPLKGKELELCGLSPEKMQEVHEKYSGFELEKQFECRFEHIHFEKGEMKMEGEVALKYVRSRHGNDGGDFGRSERQTVVLEGLKEKLISLEIVKKSPKLLDAIIKNVKTDITLDEIKDFYDLVGNSDEYEITTVHLTEDNVLTSSNGLNGFILLPKEGNNQWKEIREFIYNNL